MFELDYPENGNQHGPRATMQIVDAEQAAATARADVAALAALGGVQRKTLPREPSAPDPGHTRDVSIH